MTQEIRDQSNQREPEPSSSLPSIWRLVSRQAVPIVPFNESGCSPAIYCVHPISGDVTSFQDLAEALRPVQRFFGIQVPGSKMKAGLCTTIQEVARHHVDAVCRFQPDGPVILAGWSVGAIIALEMAQQLTAAGRDVPLLIALDGAPCNTGAGLRRWTPRYMWELTRNVPGWLRSHARDSPSLLLFVQRMIMRANFRFQTAFPLIRTEQTLNADPVLRVLGSQGWKSQQRYFIRSLFQASLDYIPTKYYGETIVYESKVQPLDHLLQVGAVWRKIAPQAEIVQLSGNHESIVRSPDVAVLAEHLLARLARLHNALYCTIPLTSAKSGSQSEESDTKSSARHKVVASIDRPTEVGQPAPNCEIGRINVSTDVRSPGVCRAATDGEHQPDPQQLGFLISNHLMPHEELAERKYYAQIAERHPIGQLSEHCKVDDVTRQAVRVQHAAATLF